MIMRILKRYFLHFRYFICNGCCWFVVYNFCSNDEFNQALSVFKKVLDGKYDLPENGDNEEEVWKKEPFLSFIKWDRKRCIIQSIASAVFFV
ncbi:hypothetical protein OQE50_24410 (plasmid) [Enterobacter kobei]|uniref:hypothetical protein n=1 Tax=Enterobacter kobei TaxID=208224 RepID=UPI00224B7D9E|nr:hypothetical protein [Enterobacter kobei]UZQ70323.1 hypothetical protein OQE50_24410 [Enterobacter kobei]